MLKDECSKEKFKFEHLQPDDFTRCYWQKKPNILPIWLAYRLVIFVYFLGTYVFMTFLSPHEEDPWYKNIIFYGNWTYFVELLVFALAFYITVRRFLKERKDSELPPTDNMPWQYKLLWALYNVAAPGTVAVTVLFWLFTYNPQVNSFLGRVLLGGLFNSLILILDFCLSSIPYRFLHFYLPCSFAIVYTTFSVIYQTSGGTGRKGQIPIYRIVDWRKPQKALVTVGIYLGCHFLFHCTFCVLNLIKQWVKRPNQ